MKYINILLLLPLLIFASACSNDELSSQSIFNTSAPERTEFDTWILNNYTKPYNIQFNYLYNDKLSDNYYNVAPATIQNSKAMAILLKHIWLDAYKEAVGEDFVKSNTFRVIQLIGTPEYNSQNEIILGTAEGGVQITLFRLNELDLDNIYVNQNNPFEDHTKLPLDLNYWYFKTMHHEFCHILTQKKNYSTEFATISAGGYHASDWVNVDDIDAPLEGFVSGYASKEYNEDFAELYSTYVTSSPEAWEQILNKGIKYSEDGITVESKSGRDKIVTKMGVVKSYFQTVWGVNLDELRTIVLRRSSEAATLDLKNLK